MNKKTIIPVVLALFLILCVGCDSPVEDLTIEDLTKLMQGSKKLVRADSALSISPDIKANGLDGPVYHKPADISGTWTGTYSCTNTGCPDEGGPITLTITQNGNSAHYEDDEGALYDGTVCGNVFEFDGGITGGFTESGTFVLNAEVRLLRPQHGVRMMDHVKVIVWTIYIGMGTTIH